MVAQGMIETEVIMDMDLMDLPEVIQRTTMDLAAVEVTVRMAMDKGTTQGTGRTMEAETTEAMVCTRRTDRGVVEEADGDL